MEFGDGPFDEKYFYRDTQRKAYNLQSPTVCIHTDASNR